MADISTYLANITNAHYGEEVRSSIYNAINIINQVGEVQITIGTAVTSTSSSIVGYFKNSIYINSNTWDVWRCTGSVWENVGNIKGSHMAKTTKTGTKSKTNNLVDIYKVYDNHDIEMGTFEVTNGSTFNLTKNARITTVTKFDPDGSSLAVNIFDGSKIGVGTAVSATNSSVSNYYTNDCYINKTTFDLWRCTNDSGNNWVLEGNLKGTIIQSVVKKQVKANTNDLVDIYSIKDNYGNEMNTFEITNGTKVALTQNGLIRTLTVYNTDGTTSSFDITKANQIYVQENVSESTSINGAYINDIAIDKNNWNLWRCTNYVSSTNVGNTWELIGNIKGAKGDKGDQGIQGIQGIKGDTGFSPTVSTSKSGKITTITITDINGSHSVELKDGSDGDGTGDMLKATYDPDDDGIVEHAKVADSLTSGSDFVAKDGDTMTGSLTVGTSSTTSGNHSVSIGTSNTTNGNYSLSVGSSNTAQGTASAALGQGVRATADGQVVVGKYNDILNDSYHTDALFEVGIGTSTGTRMNGFQILHNGDAIVYGDIYTNSGDTKIGGGPQLVGVINKTVNDWVSRFNQCMENVIIDAYDANKYYYIIPITKTGNVIYGMDFMIQQVVRVNATIIRVEYYEVRTSVVETTDKISGTYTLGVFAVPKLS